MSDPRSVLNVFICPIGFSPGVVTSFVYKMASQGVLPDKVLLIGSSDRRCYASAAIAKAQLVYGKPPRGIPSLGLGNGDVVSIFIDGPDVTTRDEVEKFVEMLAGKLRLFRDSPDYSIHLLVTGGRKMVSTVTLIMSMVVRPLKAYHVYTKGVDGARGSINDEVVQRFFKALNTPKEFEERAKEILDMLPDDLRATLAPDPNDIELTDMTPIPYPRDYIDLIKKLINKGSISKGGSAAASYISALLRAGLIEDKGDMYTPSEQLGFWAKVFREAI